MSLKNLLKILFPIIMTALMLWVIKLVTTDTNSKAANKAADMISNPIEFLSSGVYDIFSVYFPEYGDKGRRHKVISEYQDKRVDNIVQPLQELKDNNKTEAYNALKAKYVQDLFKISQSPNGTILEIKALLSSGIDINIQDEKQRTILYYATSTKNSYLVRYLLNHGADPKIKDYVGLSAVDLLTPQNDKDLYLAFHHDDVAEEAKSKGMSNISANYSYDQNGKITDTKVYGEKQSSWTPLMQAIKNRNNAEATQYITNNQYIHKQTNNGSTALFFAIKFKNNTIFDMLLENGADIAHRNNFQMNPLALAIKTDNIYALKKLVQHGADIHAVCASSRTPIKYAEVNRRDDMKAYLQSVGAS